MPANEETASRFEMLDSAVAGTTGASGTAGVMEEIDCVLARQEIHGGHEE